MALAAVLAVTLGASGTGCRKAEPVAATIAPGPGAQEELRRTLIEARGGGVITLGKGRFHLDAPIVIDAPGLRLRGQGMRETILDFSGVTSGSGDGLLVTGDRFSLEDLGIESTPGDAVRLQKATGLAIRRVYIDWPGTPNFDHGGYGIYPIESQDLVIEDNVIRGAADSGIYVGQSKRALVRRNEVSESVAGIQIENSVDVEVRDNQLHTNAAGLLAFALPELPGGTRRVRIAGNTIANNNAQNFARPAARVSAIPSGSGVILMAADQVEVRDNRIANHQTGNLSIYSHAVLQEPQDHRDDDPTPEAIWIHGNHFEGGGEAPKGPLAERLLTQMGVPFPDIVFDGVVDPRKLVDGALPPALRFYIDGNGDADFIDLDLVTFLRGDPPRMSKDLTRYAGTPTDFPEPTPPEQAQLP
jgi:parallel beta-helix repeat protein